MLRGGHHPKSGRRQRTDHQAESETGQCQIGVEGRQGQRSEFVAGGEHVDPPVRHQPVGECGDQHARHGHRPVTDPGGQPATGQGADRQGGQKVQQQQGGTGLIPAQHTLTEQFNVDQGHHQRGAGAHRGSQRRQERPELDSARFYQPGAGEAFPHRERDRGHEGADQQGRPVTRQDLLAVGGRVVQPPHRQTQRQRQQYTTDDVDPFRFRAALVGRQAEVDQHHRDQGERHVDPEHVAPGVE